LNALHSSPKKDSRRPTVLIVEDDIVIRSSLAEYLRAAGYMVVESANAAEAIALFGAGVPIDLVFSDISMPGAMDGLGLARWIRQHQPGVRLMLTSGGNTASARKIAEIFVPKPYHVAEVAARIGQLLGAAGPPTLGSDIPQSQPVRPRSRQQPSRRPRRTRESREPEPDQRQKPSRDDKDPDQH
jgi:CheY-like chemotaxis protein